MIPSACMQGDYVKVAGLGEGQGKQRGAKIFPNFSRQALRTSILTGGKYLHLTTLWAQLILNFLGYASVSWHPRTILGYLSLTWTDITW